MKNVLYLFFLLLYSATGGYASSVDSLMQELDAAIELGEEYQKIRESRIEGLKLLVENPNLTAESKYQLYTNLFDEYRKYRFDSAIHYIELKTEIASSVNNSFWLNETYLQQVKLMSATGMYKEAFDVLGEFKTQEIAPSLIPEYYSILSNIYGQMAHYTNIPSKSPEYWRLRAVYQDSSIALLTPGTLPYKREMELYYYRKWMLDESRSLALELLNETDPKDADYAYYAYRIACTYRDQSNYEKEKEYLIKSAIADIKNGIKDNASLSMLAMMLYKENKIIKAYDYIQYSLADAAIFNAPLRYIELSNVLPTINEAYNHKLERQTTQLQRYILLISFLTVFLIASIYFIFKQIKNVSRARNEVQQANQQLNNLNNALSKANKKFVDLNHTLLESNHIKEQYIGHFLNRCSNYIDKMQDYQKFVNKQLKLRKVEELFQSTKSNKLINDELNEFYQTFDQTFLILFPDFVNQINELFIEKERIVLKDGELLTTELRIFALIRLGVHDSSKIASLLRYSVNTIYNYRVKIKNKSLIPRDEFEDRVKQIGNFSG